MMAAKMCPPPEMLSAFIDRELQPVEQFELSRHVPGCAHCGAILSGLRDVDAILLNAPTPVLQRRRAVALVRRPRPRLRRVTVLLIVLAIVLSVAAGCAFAARMLGVFRTEHHVVTRPAAEFPAADWKDMAGGYGIEITPSVQSVEQVSDSLGAHLLEPSEIPADYVLLQRSSPFRNHAEIIYINSRTYSIDIRESNHKYGPIETPPIPPSAAESIRVNGHAAIYVRGGWSQEDPSAVPIWREDIVHSVTFDAGDLTVEIDAPPDVSKQELIAMAESIR